MITVQFSKTINAPVQKVWDIMLWDEWYRQRTKPFNPAWSRYEGDRSQGSKIRFLWPDPRDATKIGGMYSEIAENKPYEFISIRHLGEVNGTEVKEMPEWDGASENYSFSEKEGVTTVDIRLDVPEDFKEYMEETWPQALTALKDLSEAA